MRSTSTGSRSCLMLARRRTPASLVLQRTRSSSPQEPGMSSAAVGLGDHRHRRWFGRRLSRPWPGLAALHYRRAPLGPVRRCHRLTSTLRSRLTTGLFRLLATRPTGLRSGAVAIRRRRSPHRPRSVVLPLRLRRPPAARRPNLLRHPRRVRRRLHRLRWLQAVAAEPALRPHRRHRPRAVLLLLPRLPHHRRLRRIRLLHLRRPLLQLTPVTVGVINSRIPKGFPTTSWTRRGADE